MFTTFCLLSCVLATGQVPGRPGGAPAALPGPLDHDAAGWVLSPSLGRAEEIIYRGTFTEESTSRGVQFHRFYRLENRLFVLEAPARGPEVAFLTLLRGQHAAPANGDEPAAASVRLEVVRVDLQGRVAPTSPRSLAVPLEGPPTIECGAFVETPPGRLRPQQTWETSEEGRPARTWRVAGSEAVNATSCLKLVGVQQSDDWDRPRDDRAAWRRTDTVWLSPRLDLAYRVERVIERRDAGRETPNHRSVLRYELESDLPYPGKLYEDRKDEILHARTLLDRAAPLLAHPTPDAAGQLDALLGTVRYHLEHHLPTPYREAVLQLKRRLEAAKRGETPPAPVPDEAAPAAPPVAVPGAAAPDFLTTDLGRRQSARLRQFLGRPIVLVFYNPASFQAEEVLRFAQRLADFHKDEVHVLGLVMSEDVERVQRQRDELGLTFPLLDGTGLRRSYDVQTTPKFLVLDAHGLVRGSYLGWGQEAPLAVVADLKRCLAPHSP
jgi:peroxiredoxin